MPALVVTPNPHPGIGGVFMERATRSTAQVCLRCAATPLDYDCVRAGDSSARLNNLHRFVWLSLVEAGQSSCLSTCIEDIISLAWLRGESSQRSTQRVYA